MQGKVYIGRSLLDFVRVLHRFAVADVGRRHQLAEGDGGAGELEHPVGRQGGDLHRRQRVGRRVVRIAETKVGRQQRVAAVLVDGRAVVAALRRVVHTGDVDGEGVGRLVEVDAAVGGAAV